MAQDKGYPPLQRTVEVQIDVVDRANNPPVWDQVVYGPIYVKENMPVGGKVASIKARSVIKIMIMKQKTNNFLYRCITFWFCLYFEPFCRYDSSMIFTEYSV